MTKCDRKDYHFPNTSKEVYGRQLQKHDFEDKENSYYWAFIVIGLLMVVLYAL